MVTETARVELVADGTPSLYLELAVVESADFDAPLRLCNSGEEGFTIRSAADPTGSGEGELYYAYPFRATWPARDPSQPFAGARFEINNVVAQDGTDEPVLLAALRGLPSRARVRFIVIRRDAPDVAEQKTTRIRLTGIGYTATVITGTLEMPDFSGRRASGRFTPDAYPNLRQG